MGLCPRKTLGLATPLMDATRKAIVAVALADYYYYFHLYYFRTTK
jgi:hypothetical protein